jgi:ADP-ribose pyrophosphatase
MKKSKTLTSENRYINPWWIYKVDKYLFPNGVEGEYHYVYTSGSAFIIPVTDDGKLIMVNQYRYLNDRFSLEFPGGGIKAGQKPTDVARKELVEETGFDGDFEFIGVFNPFNGVTNELCHVFIARGLKKSNEFKKDESEEFEIHILSVEEVEEKIKSNEIYDGMTMAAWALVKHKF